MSASLPQFIEPMALLPADTLPEGEQWFYELKWDGYRCQALKDGNNVRLFSRNGNDFTDRFSEVADAVRSLRSRSALIDGELVALDSEGRPCFQRLVEGDRRDCSLWLYGFDLLHLDGKALLRVALAERKARLAEALQGSRVRFSAPLEAKPKRLMAEVSKRLLEGVVAKRRSSLYESGRRSGAWVKWKALRQDEFVVGGYRPAGRAGSFECLLLGEYREDGLAFVGRVMAGLKPGTRPKLAQAFPGLEQDRCPFVNLPWRTRGRWQEGITAEDMQSFRWLRPSLRLRVGFMEREASGLLRHPKAVALTGWD